MKVGPCDGLGVGGGGTVGAGDELGDEVGDVEGPGDGPGERDGVGSDVGVALGGGVTVVDGGHR